MSAPMRTEGIDNASSILIPYYDQDTKIMYLAGKVSPKLHSVNLLVICFKIKKTKLLSHLLKEECIVTAKFYL